MVNSRLYPSFSAWTRNMRAQKAWKVETHILRESGPTRRATRSFISPAALLVKVIARTSSGAASPWSRMKATRCVSTRVFPLPAPARMSSGPSVCSTASSWVGFRDSSNTDKKLYQQGALDPAPKLVYEHPHLSPALLHGRAFHRGPEPPGSQSLEKSRR